jgi:acyl-CoA thioesterase-1
MWRSPVSAALAVVLCSASCAGVSCGWGTEQNGSSEPRRVSAEATRRHSTESRRPRIVALGDSLTAGLGLAEPNSYPALLQKKLDAEGYQFEVVNAGVSGDTSAGGLRRLEWALDGDVRILIVALGANDALRGLSIEEMKANLSRIIRSAQSRGIAVLLAGMEAPPNYGQDYTVQFRQAYRDLAREHRVTFVPFLLDRVAGQSRYNQADGIHPNPDGARMVAETIWRALKPMVDAAAATP